MRHAKVKGAYNPCDPEWELYGEKLLKNRMVSKKRYLKQWAKLFLYQSARCAHWAFEITEATGSHQYHMVHRVAGGADLLSSTVLLHSACHMQAHSRRLKIVKPASV